MIDSDVSKMVYLEFARVLLKLKSLHSVLSNCRIGSLRWTGDMAVSFLYDTKQDAKYAFGHLNVIER